MAKGRQGFLMEGWKFGVYLAIPILASFYFDNPIHQQKAQDYWQFVKYPANPNTGMKEAIEQAAAQQKQREAYRQQLQRLNEAATTTRNDNEMRTTERKGWLQWMGLRRRKANEDGNNTLGKD